LSGVTLSGDQYVLFVLLFKLGITASYASVLVTSGLFKRLLFLKKRTTGENWRMASVFGLLLAAGAAVRVLVGYEGVDISLSGTFLVGLIGGMVPGSSVGFFVGLPGMFGGEWAAVPFTMLCGLAGGVIRRRTERSEEFWEFSPFPLNNLVRSFRAFTRDSRLDSRVWISICVLALEVLRSVMADLMSPSVLFAFHTDRLWVNVVIWFTTLACVGIPLKIWNNTRVERLLDEERSSAVQARFNALRGQINPHFFFNTLNAATSCLWSDPEKARWILVKLSAILRQLLYSTDDYVPLSREIGLIEDYVSLEEARFGPEKIRLRKEIDPRTLDVPVPAMILQPLVENAVRHGLSPMIDGGTVSVAAERNGDRLKITVSDDGVGFRIDAGGGIGLSNVRERIDVAYGQRASFRIESAPGEGTTVFMELPVERSRKRDRGE